MPLNLPNVVLLSTDRAFSRDVAAHWPTDPNLPEFTVLDEGLFRDLGSGYDLAIADASSPGSRLALKQALAAAGKPAIVTYADPDSGSESGRCLAEPALPLLRSEGVVIELYRGKLFAESKGGPPLWAQIAGVLGREMLRSSLAEARQRQGESKCATVKAEAALGRYMMEMRHNVNNALTSILGNAELLAFEPGLPRNVAEQADTIRNMALRLHEIFQRFSSLEKELSVAARESGKIQAYGASAGR